MEANLSTKKLLGKNSGVLNGISSAILWGADTVLVGILIAQIEGLSFANIIMIAPFISAFLHDLLSSIWMIGYLAIRKQLGNVKKCFKTKSLKYVIIGGALGGPVGMAGYLLSIKYLGPSYTAILSSLYPAVGAIMAKIILKDKMNKSGWIGLVLSISGIVLLGATELTGVENSIGIIFVLLCVFGWGSEAVVCAIGMKDDEITSELALFFRQCTSAIVYGFLIVPLFKGLGASFAVAGSNIMILVAITSIFGTASYLCYYGAISKIGPTKAMGLNITYVVWAILLECVFMGNTLSINTITIGSIVMLGSYLIAKE